MNKISLLDSIRAEAFDDEIQKIALSGETMESAFNKSIEDIAKKTNIDVINPAAMSEIKNVAGKIPKTGNKAIDRAALRTATSSALSTRRNVLRTVKNVSEDVTRSAGTNLHNIMKQTPGLKTIAKIPGVRKAVAGSVPLAKNVLYKTYTSEAVRKLIQNKTTTGHIMPKTYEAIQSAKKLGQTAVGKGRSSMSKFLNMARKIKIK